MKRNRKKQAILEMTGTLLCGVIFGLVIGFGILESLDDEVNTEQGGQNVESNR